MFECVTSLDRLKRRQNYKFTSCPLCAYVYVSMVTSSLSFSIFSHHIMKEWMYQAGHCFSLEWSSLDFSFNHQVNELLILPTKLILHIKIYLLHILAYFVKLRLRTFIYFFNWTFGSTYANKKYIFFKEQYAWYCYFKALTKTNSVK